MSVINQKNYFVTVGELADKRSWNNFQGSYGKRAWNHFNAGFGKRAWNHFNAGYGKRGWNSQFAGAYGKRSYDENVRVKNDFSFEILKKTFYCVLFSSTFP